MVFVICLPKSMNGSTYESPKKKRSMVEDQISDLNDGNLGGSTSQTDVRVPRMDRGRGDFDLEVIRVGSYKGIRRLQD